MLKDAALVVVAAAGLYYTSVAAVLAFFGVSVALCVVVVFAGGMSLGYIIGR